jgi:hypothetical protein
MITARSGEGDVPELYFSEYFDISPAALEAFGAFDISLASDLPLFVDPFLLFHSPKPEYQTLHDGIVRYLVFLRDRASDDLDPGLIASWYQFKEVKQNWLGFTQMGNGGSGLGPKFARALHGSLATILNNFGEEQITRGSHLEKLTLVKSGVGRDNVSDFTTNLIKDYLLGFTERFAKEHLAENRCDSFGVARAVFNYDTEAWETRTYYLPRLGNDYVLLTPTDILTRDDTWISHSDMVRRFDRLPASIPDDQLRAQINRYFRARLSKKPTRQELDTAVQQTIAEFPELIDRYIRLKEDDGDRAVGISEQRRDETRELLVRMVKAIVADVVTRKALPTGPITTYAEALDKVHGFKRYIENQDGYRLINKPGADKPFSNEKDVQLYFGLIFFASVSDVNREVNNGRGPVDFKVSRGAFDKTLIEIKLASNSQLKRNLERQVEIYEKANETRSSVKMIVCYTAEEQVKVAGLLRDLGLESEEAIVVVDARADNKPSGSKA